MLLIIPLPLFFAQTVFGVRGLTAWVVIGMIWTFFSAFTVVLYPLWESRSALQLISKGIIKVCASHVVQSSLLKSLSSLGYFRKRKWEICYTHGKFKGIKSEELCYYHYTLYFSPLLYLYTCSCFEPLKGHN